MEKAAILIVEDNSANRRILELSLRHLNTDADIETAEHGAQGLERVKGREFVLIFMDIEMPIMDGLECTIAIRQYEMAQSSNPSVIVAHTAGITTRAECLQVGMNDFYEKPLLLKNLKDVLTTWTPGLLP